MATGVTGCNKSSDTPKEQEEMSIPKNETSAVTVPDSPDNMAFKTAVGDTDITQLGVIINQPEDQDLKKITKLDTYEHEADNESLLVIPKYNGTKITVMTLEYVDDQLKPKDSVYTNENTVDGFGLLIKAVRAEVIPQLMLRLEYKGKNLDYLISANLKDGDPKLEYLTVKPIEAIQGEDTYEMISAIQDTQYTQGLNLIDSCSYDINQDGKEESVELYSKASKDENGKLMLDDGQEWTLIVKQADKIYPVFERQYVQLGVPQYTAYTSYGDDRFHLFINATQGAGMVLYDCYYDSQTDSFKRAIINEMQDISVIHMWK